MAIAAVGVGAGEAEQYPNHDEVGTDDDHGASEASEDEAIYPVFSLRGVGAPGEAAIADGGGAEGSAVSPPLAGRSTPAHGIANPLLEALLSPREGGARKRRREQIAVDAETPGLRLPTVARFSDTDAAVRPWSVSTQVPRPRKGYMQHQPNISHPLRVALIDWLVDVVEVSAISPSHISAVATLGPLGKV